MIGKGLVLGGVDPSMNVIICSRRVIRVIDPSLIHLIFYFMLDATPGDEELYLYNQISSMLVQPAPELLHQLSNYQSASEFIRTAIANPTQENENRAWEAVLPIVDKLRDFYEYAAELGKEE
jgi:hypothetical protein